MASSTGLTSFGLEAERTANSVRETARQLALDDQKFYQDYLIFFELRAPIFTGVVAVPNPKSYLFPLMFSPSQYTITEPFTAEATMTLNGGMVVEQNGCTQRRITIQGHTGFGAHILKNSPVQTYGLTGARNYTPNPNLRPLPDLILSGQRHFQYLQQTVFRAYSDLKRNPATAADTQLLFHNPRDDEHFEVIPLNTGLNRNASSPFTYPYAIELLCIGAADSKDIGVAPTDAAWVLSVRDAQRSARGIYQRIQGSLRSLTATINDVRLQAKQFIGIIDKATYIMTAVGDFVTGVKAFIDLPLAAVNALATLIETTMRVYDDALETGSALANLPNPIKQRWRTLQSALQQLAMHPESFQTPLQARVYELNDAMNTRIRGENIAPNANSLVAIRRAGTANLPGDDEIAQGEDDSQQSSPNYKSVFSYTVTQGDTIASIAARFLGSASRYRDLILLNNINPPFVGLNGQIYGSLSEASKAASLLTPGQRLAIPSIQPFVTITPSPVVLGATTDDPIDVQLLGRDLRMQQVGSNGNSPLYDLVINDNGTTADLGKAEGLDTVRQGITQRIVQQASTNILYPDVGVETVVPTGINEVDQALLRFRFNAALTRDPRITGVQTLDVYNDSGQVRVNAVLNVVGAAGVIGVST